MHNWIKILTTSAITMGLGGTAMAITPNKLLSRGLTAYTSSGENHYITDGDLTNWKQCTAKEIALNVGEGPSRLFISWESYGGRLCMGDQLHKRMRTYRYISPQLQNTYIFQFHKRTGRRLDFGDRAQRQSRHGQRNLY